MCQKNEVDAQARMYDAISNIFFLECISNNYCLCYLFAMIFNKVILPTKRIINFLKWTLVYNQILF